ncbi:hypothetical protein OEA41_001836 [Lepraria neglecta]|uniref:Uncharacterized protein n=1 Tax=Lepraria neglecta TaxID=209136 RepID=A0AAD9ZAU5_9LECA|nr:hypothetical protein OEA41_001836 [Lepraria neglecta]
MTFENEIKRLNDVSHLDKEIEKLQKHLKEITMARAEDNRIAGANSEAKEKIHVEEVSRLGDPHSRELQMIMKDHANQVQQLGDHIVMLAEACVTFNNQLENCSPSVQRSMYDHMLPETRWPACHQQAEASRYSRHNLAEFSAEIQTALNSQKPIDHSFKNPDKTDHEQTANGGVMVDQHPPGSTQTETTGPVLQKETRHSSDDLLPLEPGVSKVLDQPKNQELMRFRRRIRSPKRILWPKLKGRRLQ